MSRSHPSSIRIFIPKITFEAFCIHGVNVMRNHRGPQNPTKHRSKIKTTPLRNPHTNRTNEKKY